MTKKSKKSSSKYRSGVRLSTVIRYGTNRALTIELYIAKAVSCK